MAGERTLPGLGLTGFWDAGSTYKTGMDQNLLKLSSLAQLRVKDRDAALPGSPAVGDIYIVVDSDPTYPNHIAVWDGPAGSEAWTYLPPAKGYQAYVEDEDAVYRYSGTAWVQSQVTGVTPIIEVLARGSVIDATLTTPPGSPNEGDSYIVAASATGDWAGQDNAIAIYVDSAWEFHAPVEGWFIRDQTNDVTYQHDSTVWAEFNSGGGGIGGSSPQAMTDETANRALETSYQNTSDHPLLVLAALYGNNDGSLSNFELQTSPDDAVWTKVANDGTGTDHNWMNFFGVVPAGYYYRVTQVTGGNTSEALTKWYEQIQGGGYALSGEAVTTIERSYLTQLKTTSDKANANYTTPLAISWDAEDRDEGGLWASGSQIVIPAGVVVKSLAFSGRVVNDGVDNSHDDYSIVHLYKNGSTYASQNAATRDTYARAGFAFIGVDASPGDVFEIYFQYGTDTAVSVRSSSQCFVSMVLEEVVNFEPPAASGGLELIGVYDLSTYTLDAGNEIEVDVSGYSAVEYQITDGAFGSADNVSLRFSDGSVFSGASDYAQSVLNDVSAGSLASPSASYINICKSGTSNIEGFGQILGLGNPDVVPTVRALTYNASSSQIRGGKLAVGHTGITAIQVFSQGGNAATGGKLTLWGYRKQEGKSGPGFVERTYTDIVSLSAEASKTWDIPDNCIHFVVHAPEMSVSASAVTTLNLNKNSDGAASSFDLIYNIATNSAGAAFTQATQTQLAGLTCDAGSEFKFEAWFPRSLTEKTRYRTTLFDDSSGTSADRFLEGFGVQATAEDVDELLLTRSAGSYTGDMHITYTVLEAEVGYRKPTITATTALTLADVPAMAEIDTSAGAMTVTLPAAAPVGTIVSGIMIDDSNIATWSAPSGENLDTVLDGSGDQVQTLGSEVSFRKTSIGWFSQGDIGAVS